MLGAFVLFPLPEIAHLKKGFGLTLIEMIRRFIYEVMFNDIKYKSFGLMSKECLNIVENEFNTKKMSEKFSKFVKSLCKICTSYNSFIYRYIIFWNNLCVNELSQGLSILKNIEILSLSSTQKDGLVQK